MKKYLKQGYLIVISTVLPLYMGRGYYELGERKAVAYLAISLFFALLFLLFQNKELFKKGKLPAFLSYALLVFLFSNAASFLYSVDKKTAFLGLKGWRNGLLSILICIFFFYVYYEEERINGYILAIVFFIPFLESILIILNRFDFYPFEIYGKNDAFLATMGNINWLVGYFSVFVPAGIGFCYAAKMFSKEFFLWGIYVLVTLTALFLQGSDSAAMVICASFLVLLFYAIGSRESFRRFLAVLFIFGIAMEGAFILYCIFEKRYTYQDNFLLTICKFHTGLIIIAFVFFIFCLSRLFELLGLSFMEKTYRFIFGFIVGLLLFTAFVYVFKNFDYTMGNGRGLIYSMTLDMFSRMEPLRKLFGAGEDCFYAYAYSDPETADSLLNVFGGNALTNAHCAPLTILIERGLLGLLSYIFLIAVLVKEIFLQKNKHAAVICALTLSSYLVNSLVSFELIVSTPYLFLVLAIGLSYKEISD